MKQPTMYERQGVRVPAEEVRRMLEILKMLGRKTTLAGLGFTRVP
jgi:hypothetical protein